MQLKKVEEGLHQRLRDADYAAAYVEAALDDGGIDEFLFALRDVAIATGGVGEVAKKSRHGRESLYKSLSRAGNPRIKTVDDVLRVLGLRMAITRVRTEKGARTVLAQ